MSFIDISRSLEFASGKVFKKDFLNGIFIGSKASFELPANFLTVCDANTKYIASQFTNDLIIISKADMQNVEHIMQMLQEKEGIVAIGSGSVFDVCKLASFKKGKPFIGYATALSMNGYLSSTASIITNGIKKSHPAHLVSKLYFDLEVLKNAPIMLTKAGMGDSLARASAQADNMLGFEKDKIKYLEELYEIRFSSEEFILQNYLGLEKRDDEFFLQLLENILFAGIAMHIYESSIPASGGEHAMAHIFESEYDVKNEFLHGIAVAGFTCEMLKIQNYKIMPRGDYMQALKYYKIPTDFSNLNLNANQFEEIKLKAANYRERFSYLSK